MQKLIQIVFEEKQAMDLLDKYFISTVLNMLKEI